MLAQPFAGALIHAAVKIDPVALHGFSFCNRNEVGGVKKVFPSHSRLSRVKCRLSSGNVNQFLLHPPHFKQAQANLGALQMRVPELLGAGPIIEGHERTARDCA